MYLTEDYNSPQSVYWALKSLVVLGLTEDDAFWAEPEVPYPEITPASSVKLLPGPRHILCNRPEGNHHFLLATAQFIGIPFKAVMAKYSKFAYSSAFGFSVPTGANGLGQIAPDNVLALSRDGTETWAVKYKCNEPHFSKAIVQGTKCEELPVATVRWYPWADRCVSVDTTVIPPSARWPDWHIRIHRLRVPKPMGRIFTAEGGFAVDGRQRQNTYVLPVLNPEDLDDEAVAGDAEGVLQNEDSVLILSTSGASGVATELHGDKTTTVAALKPEPNTNIMVQRSLIPLIENNIPWVQTDSEVVLVAKVFAIASNSGNSNGLDDRTLKQRWLDRPVVSFDGKERGGSKDYISLEPV